MESIEKESFAQLLRIVPDHPLIRLLHFADSGEEIPLLLDAFVNQKGYEYQINALTQPYFETMQEHFDENDAVKPVRFTLERPRYMIQGKLYDYVFVTADIPSNMRESFLQKVHPVMKNGGNILLFLTKGDRTQRWEWTALLEENYYVATSTIDDLFAHYDVVISKKMHGWGG